MPVPRRLDGAMPTNLRIYGIYLLFLTLDLCTVMTQVQTHVRRCATLTHLQIGPGAPISATDQRKIRSKTDDPARRISRAHLFRAHLFKMPSYS